MKILPLASGSTGNCTYVEIDGHKIIIDLGVRMKQLRQKLALYNLSLEDIEAVFITHSHYDHVLGYPVTVKHLNCRVFTSKRTRDELYRSIVRGLPYDETEEVLPGLCVTVFETSHDCPGSCGFVFETEHEKLTYATDLGCIPEELYTYALDSDVCLIESNHDEEMLWNGPYPYYLKQRIASDHGHLSNHDCAAFCRHLEEHGTQNFLLAHRSQQNNTPELALKTTQEVLKETSSVRVLKPFDEEMLEYPTDSYNCTEQSR